MWCNFVSSSLPLAMKLDKCTAKFMHKICGKKNNFSPLILHILLISSWRGKRISTQTQKYWKFCSNFLRMTWNKQARSKKKHTLLTPLIDIFFWLLDFSVKTFEKRNIVRKKNWVWIIKLLWTQITYYCKQCQVRRSMSLSLLRLREKTDNKN